MKWERPPKFASIRRADQMKENSDHERQILYEDLHARQLEAEEGQNRHSAETILKLLFHHFQPASVLDVGCGLGTWLSVVQSMGVGEITGIDGPWIEKSNLRVPKDVVMIRDLERPFDLGRRYDLAICLEVAEHLDEKDARSFVTSIAAHADVVLFSAAIPFQGGHHHINEQWPDYWRALFGAIGYDVLDFIRPEIWWDDSVLWWLRQNVVVYVKANLLGAGGPFGSIKRNMAPLSVVHPEVYTSRLQIAHATLAEHQQLMALLGDGGTFSVKKESNGSITISKL